MKLHANARLSVKGRELLIGRVLMQGWSLAQAAEAAGVSDRTAAKWVARFRLEGEQGLLDRLSAPRSSPSRTPDQRVQVIAALRRLRMTGAEIAECLNMAVTTVSGILTKIGMGKLGQLGLQPAQRYERQRPGELIHIDVKKLGRIERGAGHRVTGTRRGNPTKTDGSGIRRRQVGWEYVHVAVDDATRLAYVEVLSDERATTAIGFLSRAIKHYAGFGISVEALITDNGSLPLNHPRNCLPNDGDPPPTHTPLPPPDQRQGGAIHPHDARRLGLRRDLPRQQRENRSTSRLARAL
jgi:transposase